MTKKVVKEEKKKEKGVNDNAVPNFVAMESCVGVVSMLAAKSKNHKHLFMSDLEWLVLPPIMLKQFKIFRAENNEPAAFVSYAKVNQEVEKRLLSGVVKLAPKDWNSGDRIWIIDVIDLVGKATSTILKQLAEKEFKGQEVRILSRKKDGSGVEGKVLSY